MMRKLLNSISLWQIFSSNSICNYIKFLTKSYKHILKIKKYIDYVKKKNSTCILNRYDQPFYFVYIYQTFYRYVRNL